MLSSKPSKFGRIAVSIVVAATVLLGYGVFWWIAAGRFQSAALAWIDARRADGYTVEYSAMEREGFPIRLRLAFRDPVVAFPSGAAPWSWSGSRAVAEIAPWAPLEVTLRADGRQMFAIPGPDGPLVYTGTAAMVSASITPDRSLPVRAITIRDLILSGRDNNDAVAAARLDMTLGQGEDVKEPGMDDGYDLSVVASDLQLPARLRLPLGERVSHLALAARVIGNPHARPWPGGLFQWRDAGGIVEVAELDVHYGPLRLTGTGTLALDGDGQPMGAFIARAEGLPETLDALDRRGLLKGFGVASAKLVVRILSRPSETGEPDLRVPLSLQDRTLFAASLPLLEVPAINWTPGSLDGPR